MEERLMCFADWLVETFNEDYGESQEGYNYVGVLKKYSDYCKSILGVDTLDYVDWLKSCNMFEDFCGLLLSRINDLSYDWLENCMSIYKLSVPVSRGDFGVVSAAVWDYFLRDDAFWSNTSVRSGSGKTRNGESKPVSERMIIENFVSYLTGRINELYFRVNTLDECLRRYTSYVHSIIFNELQLVPKSSIRSFEEYLSAKDVNVVGAVAKDDWKLLLQMSKMYIRYCISNCYDSERVNVVIINYYSTSYGQVFEDVRKRCGIVSALLNGEAVNLIGNLHICEDGTFVLKGTL